MKIVEVRRIPTNVKVTVKFENGTICPQAVITLVSGNWLTEKNASYAAFTFTGEYIFKSVIPDEYDIYVSSFYKGQYNGRSWIEILPWEGDVGKTIEKTVIIS